MNEIDVLAARQEKLLLQLEEFKKQLQTIRSGLNLCAKPAQEVASRKGGQQSVKSSHSAIAAPKPIDVSLVQLEH